MEFVVESREKWIESRSKGIGGSEVAAVLGLDPYKSPYSVWVEKTTGNRKEIDNIYTRAGHKLEPVVVEYFTEETGYVIDSQKDGDFHQVTHPQYDYMRGSRDRVYFTPDGTKCILECKTTQTSIDKDNMPMTWYCQLQWYLGLYNVEKGAIAWLERGLRFDYLEISLDRNFFTYLVEKVKEFWEDYVLTNVEPPYLHLHDIESKYPLHTDGSVIEATNELYDVYNQLKEIRERKKELEIKEEHLIGEFKLAMKDSERVMYSGEVLATWRTDKDKYTFDVKGFVEAHPEIVKEYQMIKSGVRRFLLK